MTGPSDSSVPQAAPLSSYSPEDRAFYEFWYGHMLNDLMQPPLAGIAHATARYIWDVARRAALPVAASDERRVADYEAGWNNCAIWAGREDLLQDTTSPAYIKERDALLAQAAQPLPVAAPSDADRELMEQQAIRMRDALDAIYGHNAAARAAVVMHYGIHHHPAIAALRTRLLRHSEGKE